MEQPDSDWRVHRVLTWTAASCAPTNGTIWCQQWERAHSSGATTTLSWSREAIFEEILLSSSNPVLTHRWRKHASYEDEPGECFGLYILTPVHYVMKSDWSEAVMLFWQKVVSCYNSNRIIQTCRFDLTDWLQKNESFRWMNCTELLTERFKKTLNDSVNESFECIILPNGF